MKSCLFAFYMVIFVRDYTCSKAVKCLLSGSTHVLSESWDTYFDVFADCMAIVQVRSFFLLLFYCLENFKKIIS